MTSPVPHRRSVASNAANVEVFDAGDGVAQLAAGSHRFDLRFVVPSRQAVLEFDWLQPGEKRFSALPEAVN